MRALGNLWRGFDQDEGREFDEELLFGRNEPSPRSNPRFACSPELGKNKNNQHKKETKKALLLFQTKQKKEKKHKKGSVRFQVKHLVQEPRDWTLSKPRDFCFLVTMVETGWGLGFPLLT